MKNDSAENWTVDLKRDLKKVTEKNVGTIFLILLIFTDNLVYISSVPGCSKHR